MLWEVIHHRGMSDTAAALTLGIGRSTLSGWKKQHPELDEWLEMAREKFREAKLAIVDEAKTRDGRPDWRAAVWALEKAFPQDYGRRARPRREEEGERMGWMASASVLANAFPEEYGDLARAGKAGAGPALPRSQDSADDWRPSREMIGGLIEENIELREQLNALLPAS
jgi:hypothetical protein